MQSFQDFLQNRRNKSAESGDLQALEHSRPEHASPLANSGKGLQHSQSKACPVDLEESSPERSAAAAAAAAAAGASPAAAAALTAHTTTTVSGATAPGSRYLSRSSTAAGSKHKLSDGVSAVLQQLISPQRSAALMSQSNSFRNSTGAAAAAPGTADSPSTDLHAAAVTAAAAAGIAELRTIASSRSAGHVSAGTSRLQPLSVADALHSPLSRSTAVTPPGALTPTGARTPTGGRRYAAAASAGGVSAGSDAGAAAGSWSVERSATCVLQEAAARAAALHRSTSMKSQASQRDLTGLQGSSSAQRVLQQQNREQIHQQVQQQWPGGQLHQQQPHQQQFGQAALQPPQQHLLLQQQQQQHEQHQRENVAALLHDLDRRFASIKDSLKGVFSPQDSMQHRFTAGSAAATVAPDQFGYAVSRGANDGAKYQHVMTEPYSLDDESSENSSKVSPRVGPQTQQQPAGHLSGSPQRRQQQPQQQQQQQLLSPTDSSSNDDSSDDEHPEDASWHHHQQQQQRPQHTTPSPQHASRRSNGVKADVTLSGGLVTAGRQQGKPAAIAAAAAAAAATTAAAADGSLPIEVDVKCGEEGELQGATAHFIVSHVTSPDASGSRRAQQQQQHTQHIKQQQLLQEPSLPSTYRMLSAEQSDLSFPALSPRGPAHETDSHYSSANLSAAGAPQPRSNKPKPSIPQRQQQAFQGTVTGKVASGGAAAAVAAAGRGVLDADADRWCSNALILAKQQAKELQQQNDALVRVLERERQQHTRTRQQVTELKLDLQTAQAEWEVKLHALRQEKLAAETQLQQALAGGEQQEIFAAYDAALAASAARTEEAQAAAARLATQMTELELQVQQLQLIYSTTAAAAADGSGAPLPRSRPVSGSSRADNAATLRAVASAECRSPDKRSPCRNGFAPGPAVDGCGGRGVRALRQHQTHLEQQVAKLSEELSQLQRDNIKLMRYKKQYEVAAQSLQSSGGAKAAAEAFAQEAGLRAAAAAGRGDKLEMQVVDLQKQVQQLKAERDSSQLHLQISQQQQRLQASLSAGASSSYNLPSGPEQYSGSDQQPPAALAGIYGSAAWGAAFGGSGAAGLAGTGSTAGAQEYMPQSLSDSAAAADVLQGQVGSQSSMQGQQSSGPLTGSAARTGSGGLVSGEGTRRSSASVSRSGSGSAQPAGAQAAVSAAEQEAICVVQQLRASLPDAAPAQGQLAALMNAIQAGVQERQALAAQGKVLLDILVGSN